MRDSVVDLLRQMEAGFAAGDAEGVAGLYSETAVLRDMTIDEPLVGRTVIADALTELFGVLTEFGYATTLVSDDGETAAVEWVTTGRHTGSFGDESPTGNLVEYRGVNLLTFDEEGLVSEERCYWDSVSLARQIGTA